jgi:hypothetical protein
MSYNEEYNSDPVYFCENCYSLYIKHDDFLDADYCAKCGCSNIVCTDIKDWEKLYENRYKRKLVTRAGDPNVIKVYGMTWKEIKQFICDSPKWESIVCRMYPHLRNRYGRADTLMMFFDLVTRQNRINELKDVLVKYIV